MGGDRRAIVRCSQPLETYIALLPRLLKQARQNGRAVATVSRSQLVLARDFSHPAQQRFEDAEARQVARWPANDVVLYWGSSLRRMRDRHYNSPYLAPLALLPLEIEDKVDLLLGQLDYSVWVNVSSVASILRGRGFLAEPMGPPESARWFLRAGRIRGNTLSTVHVTAHVREMMAIELVTPAYVAKLTDTLLNSLNAFPELVDEQALVAPGDESATWSGKR